MDEIRLSVVATSRNDDHGAGLLPRMQSFVDGLIAQCRRHALRAELILVEWNPPADRPGLAAALRWPDDPQPCSVRIVTVPPELHRRLAHSDKLPLFQMIAKNAGIRRARGRYVLATNIDVLFSDEAMRFLRDRLSGRCVYLADRVDVPADVPRCGDFEAVLRFCRDRGFRIHAGGFTALRRQGRWRRMDLLRAAMSPRQLYFAELLASPFRLALRPGDGLKRASAYLAREAAVRPWEDACGTTPLPVAAPRRHSSGPGRTLLAAARLRLEEAWRVVTGELMPFTNACGDFTAMAREDWCRLRGYPEWPLYSWNLDTALIHQARGSGLRIERLGRRARIFHIEHDGGYVAHAPEALFSRLRARGLPFLGIEDVAALHAHIGERRRTGQPVLFNDERWGFAEAALAEISPSSSRTQRRSDSPTPRAEDASP